MNIALVGTTGEMRGRQEDFLRQALMTFKPERLSHGDNVGIDAVAHTFCANNLPQTTFEIYPLKNAVRGRAYMQSGKTVIHQPLYEPERKFAILDGADLLIVVPATKVAKKEDHYFTYTRFAKGIIPTLTIYPTTAEKELSGDSLRAFSQRVRDKH